MLEAYVKYLQNTCLIRSHGEEMIAEDLLKFVKSSIVTVRSLARQMQLPLFALLINDRSTV